MAAENRAVFIWFSFLSFIRSLWALEKDLFSANSGEVSAEIRIDLKK
jgi:hypothetical protein